MSQRDLNFRQWHWIKLLADYDISILCHSGKASVVVDTLSRKAGSIGSLAYLPTVERPLALDIQSLANRIVMVDISDYGLILDFVRALSFVLDKIHGRQFEDGALYIPNEFHVFRYDSVKMDNRLTFVEESITILPRDVFQLF
ncbi:uncharacterized protein LOC129884321 [Solanum dulcamara]|uniref:uncharacterized protein LOC129884321 n=1 Tax=Solanum dulcamara TaxID=45834 RepID=UPI00248625C8|nr:uncharacterized protein LOC129884321 [Solanum dulcamara]